LDEGSEMVNRRITLNQRYTLPDPDLNMRTGRYVGEVQSRI